MDSGKTQAIHEMRRTMFKLHPNQEKYPGHVIVMPSLPFDQYSQNIWSQKGYKLTPQELKPNEKIEYVDGEPRFAAPPPEPTAPPKVCSVCGKECVGDFGLNSHMRSHDKK